MSLNACTQFCNLTGRSSAEAIVEAEAHFKANTISAEFKNSGSGKAVLNVHWHVISADKSKQYAVSNDPDIQR